MKTASRASPARAAHPVWVRLLHWVGAFAMFCMIFSGWQIYNASPILPFVFPRWMTLGGWLGGAIAWHLAAMWLLVADGLLYILLGLVLGHFRRDMLPVRPRSVLRDLGRAFSGRLGHRLGHYNAVQRLLYLGVIALAVLMVLTGLSIWKPVQLGWLTALFGGYPTARVLHFCFMSLIVGFIVVHLALVALYPRTLLSMVAPLRAEPDGDPGTDPAFGASTGTGR